MLIPSTTDWRTCSGVAVLMPCSGSRSDLVLADTHPIIVIKASKQVVDRRSGAWIDCTDWARKLLRGNSAERELFSAAYLLFHALCVSQESVSERERFVIQASARLFRSVSRSCRPRCESFRTRLCWPRSVHEHASRHPHVRAVARSARVRSAVRSARRIPTTLRDNARSPESGPSSCVRG